MGEWSYNLLTFWCSDPTLTPHHGTFFCRMPLKVNPVPVKIKPSSILSLLTRQHCWHSETFLHHCASLWRPEETAVLWSQEHASRGSTRKVLYLFFRLVSLSSHDTLKNGGVAEPNKGYSLTYFLKADWVLRVLEKVRHDKGKFTDRYNKAGERNNKKIIT